MRILITGAGGFVAPHLARELAQHGHEAWGTDRSGAGRPRFGGERFIVADLCSPTDVARLFDVSAPECVIHLAAQSNPAASWNMPDDTFRANVAAVCTLAEEAGRCKETRRVVFVSSSDVYGAPRAEELPVTERNPLRPATPYAVSKIAGESCLHLYAKRAGLEAVVMRPFSHTGPGQSENFVVPSFARQIALVEAGEREALKHGRLDTWRDFTDVRDIVRAYRLAAESAAPGTTFNVCSGAGVTIRTILETLVENAACPVPLVEDDQRLRAEAALEFRGDASAIRDALGWNASIPLAETLRAVLDEQRALVAARA